MISRKEKRKNDVKNFTLVVPHFCSAVVSSGRFVEAMNKMEVSQSYLPLPRAARDHDTLVPMYVGVSCAFLALKFLSQQELENERWPELRDKILRGSAHLLGLLVWRVQKEAAETTEKSELRHKLEAAESEIQELKRIRKEDGKANQKVTSIYASQEQSWFTERKKLRQQMGALMNDLRVLEKRKDEGISELQGKLRDRDVCILSKNNSLEEERKKIEELEEKLKTTETVMEELREKAKHEAQSHASELWKHKRAFIELVSHQRQLESEMSRVLRQTEALKQQLEFMLEEKEESLLTVQKLSIEIDKLRKDCEQKDKILSVMLRKSRSDTAERQMLLKEVKLLKAKRKKAELETERWRLASESRNERHTLRSMFLKQATKPQPNDHIALGESMDPVNGKDSEECSAESEHLSPERQDDEELSADAHRVESWVRSEAERYQTITEHRHQLELEAFTEQLRLKDDKLEACHWRLLSMEIESKRLHSQIDGLNQGINQLRHENVNLEAALLKRESELNTLKDQISLHLSTLKSYKLKLKHKQNILSSADDDSVWSDIKFVKRKSPDKNHKVKQDFKKDIIVEEDYPEIVTELRDEDEPEYVFKDPGSMIQSQIENVEEVKEVCPEIKIGCEEDVMSTAGSYGGGVGKEIVTIVPVQCLEKKKEESLPWKMDIQALGVSYKLKRLKQQLLILERLIGKDKGSDELAGEGGSDDREQMKSSAPILSLLTKQVGRYQSLQDKTDQLCKRMHEKDLDVIRAESSSLRKREETRTLEHFLEETFQLQRFMVATGQKLMDIQSKVVYAIVGISDDDVECPSFEMKKRFADNIQTLFKQVQRGLEVRISRIIGDLEGTLACDGIHFRKQKNK